jgi:hypothetical protein
MKKLLLKVRSELLRERPWPWAKSRLQIVTTSDVEKLEAEKVKLEAAIAQDQKVKELQQELSELRAELEGRRDPDRTSKWSYDGFLKNGVLQ